MGIPGYQPRNATLKKNFIIFKIVLDRFSYCYYSMDMTTTKLSMQGVVKQTGLKEFQVRYRMEQLGIVPEKVHSRLFLFSEAQVRKIAAYGRDGDAKGEGSPT